jgi:Flp pilus assembly protein TadG
LPEAIMLRPHPGKPRRTAATAVEFAAVSLVFFTFILGLVELGRGLMSSYLLTNAARQACRTGVPGGRTTADVTAAATGAVSRAGLPAASVAVLVNGTAGEAGSAQSGDRITVNVSLPVSSLSWLPRNQWLTGNLTGSYTLRRE